MLLRFVNWTMKCYDKTVTKRMNDEDNDYEASYYEHANYGDDRMTRNIDS